MEKAINSGNWKNWKIPMTHTESVLLQNLNSNWVTMEKNYV